MATPQWQIDEMNSLARQLVEQPLIQSAHIDDWGRFGNFTLMITPTHHDRATTLRLRAAVKKALPKAAHIRECFPPVAIREKMFRSTRCRILGYDRSYWTFDIDYQYYDSSTNTFNQ